MERYYDKDNYWAKKYELKERKRIREIKKRIYEQYSIVSFHRLYDYVSDKDYSIRDAEIKAAEEKLLELEKLI